MHDELALLVEDMRRGPSERALESLYYATVGKLDALAYAILRHEDDSEDVVCANVHGRGLGRRRELRQPARQRLRVVADDVPQPRN